MTTAIHPRAMAKLGAVTILTTALSTNVTFADDAVTLAPVEKFYEAFNSQNPALLGDVLAPDFVVHGTSPSLPDGDAAALGQAFQAFAAGVPDLNYEILSTHVSGDFVTVRGTVTGTHTGPLFGMPATGTKIEFGAIDIHRIVDGQVVESWHVEDFATMLRQIGVLPSGG